MKEKKYIINIDFNTRSVIHLNPKLFDIDTRCIVKEKRIEELQDSCFIL